MASEVIYFTISILILVMRCKGNHFLSYSIHKIVSIFASSKKEINEVMRLRGCEVVRFFDERSGRAETRLGKAAEPSGAHAKLK